MSPLGILCRMYSARWQTALSVDSDIALWYFRKSSWVGYCGPVLPGPSVAARGDSMAKTTGVPAIAGLLATMVLFSINGAFAADDCLLQPNREPAPGEHWYYRSDPGNDRKCWHIVESETKTSQAPVTPAPTPSLEQVQQLPFTRPGQANDQRQLPPDQADRGAFEE